MRNLELSGLQADLASVNALLESHTRDEDPLGWYQFAERKRELEAAIAGLESQPAPEAALAVFFGGAPVRGSRGILASFASQAIDAFQDLVAKRLCTMGGAQLPARGPVPGRADAQLMITDVVRGSVGFVLAEANSGAPRADTPLKDAVEAAADLLAHMSSPEDDVFEAASDDLDGRTLDAVKKLFSVLDDNGATVRVVEGERDFVLNAHAVARGRARADAIESIQEAEFEALGYLYLLPDGHRFDLTDDAAGGLLLYKGVVDRDFFGDVAAADVVGKRWRAVLRSKDVTRRGLVRTSYTLVRLAGPATA